jgi:peptidoglycan-associated lipoprotein
MMNRTTSTPRTLVTTALAASLLALLAGCDTATKRTDMAAAPVETRNASAAGAATGSAGAGASSTATPQSSVATVDLNRGAGAGAAGNTAALAMPMQRVVYFDYDSYAIKDDYKSLIDTYARVLSADKSKKVVIEGHTDERGGREYNLALGQKRAAALVQAMALLGASEGQMEAVSFGQERPAAQGSDESAWSKNRRAEVKDR